MVRRGTTGKLRAFLRVCACVWVLISASTSLQSDEEVPVALQLPHELFVLQEKGDALVLQVLLQLPVLLGGRALRQRGQRG